MLIKRWIFYDSDKIEIRLPFGRSFSTFWNIYLVIFVPKSFIHWHGLRGDSKSFVSENQKLHNHNP